MGVQGRSRSLISMSIKGRMELHVSV